MSIPSESWRPESVVLETSMGAVIVELYWDHAPNTCRNFAELARRGYYDGIKFHRIVRDFVIQGGDPTSTGRGGMSIYGEKFADELTRELKHTGAGILSMANSGPNTNGSQFFITLAPTPHLDGKHTIFGRVSSGMSNVHKMSLVATNSADRPLEDVVIVKASVL
ncbi:peptidylprolyl isomerase [Capsaspora owczarzaki ATCC 30864]|uniref:peptidylprolyl isomerase n=1 Tax=Capsaspora owczarzaki (strain ATCC 30864) TaxID=595528 RepID=UPI0001FE2EF4|nr:peptidylprolyl isomerase [Capsaspora owczarzaki ATCC 30864]|eukprot:XP_004348096.1 peptidylprolyl isomerase [Capsaspora owczarzaki ATCC 30864]